MKPWLWNIGWLLLAFGWLGPLPELAETSFAAHMTLHMLVVSIASPLLAVAAAGTRLDPVERFPKLCSPVIASVGELLIVWAWHAPVLHHFARHAAVGFLCEQTMFLGAGYWVWISAFGGGTPRILSRSASGVVGLLLTSMHMTLLGALLTLSPRLLYSHHQSLWLDPITDQHLGGAVMLVVGGASFLVGGLVLTRDLLRENPESDGPPAPSWIRSVTGATR